MSKKYELIKESRKDLDGNCANFVYRIRALKSFSDVKSGDLGGYVESEGNLSHNGNCWIYDDSAVLDDGVVKDDSIVKNGSRVYESTVEGNSAVDSSFINSNSRIINSAITRSNLYGSSIKDSVIEDTKVYLVSLDASYIKYGNINTECSVMNVWYNGKKLTVYTKDGYKVTNDPSHISVNMLDGSTLSSQSLDKFEKEVLRKGVKVFDDRRRNTNFVNSIVRYFSKLDCRRDPKPTIRW